jgi:CcmD family protein
MNFSTNPYPYIYAAYIIAAVLIFGYAFFVSKENKKLNKYLQNKK